MNPRRQIAEMIGLVASILLMVEGLVIGWRAKDNAVFMVGVLVIAFGVLLSGLMVDVLKMERSGS